MYVVTADQVGSRTGTDRVPQTLLALDGLSPAPTRPFERTAGDEIQGVSDTPGGVLEIVTSLVRQGDWRIGIGIGPVELPLPASPREGRGPAFIAAREAVAAAHPVAAQLAVRLGMPAATSPAATAHAATSDPAGGRRATADGELQRQRHTDLAEGALWLLVRLLRTRTPEGWEVTDLLSEGHPQREVARRLGISPSAVSQRVRRAGWAEQQRGESLVAYHLSVADGRMDP